MALRWNQTQKDIYELISAGVPKREIKAKGYKNEMIKKVKKAINKGDIPGKPPETKKEPPPGEPLFSATLKTKRVTLEPIVAVRYDSVRQAWGVGDEYTLERFIDECTEVVTELVGAVPPGFIRGEQETGGDDGGKPKQPSKDKVRAGKPEGAGRHPEAG